MIKHNQPAPTWNHNRSTCEAAKAEALSVLTAKAKEKDPLISYSELNRRIFSINFQPDGHDYHDLLGQLSKESDADGKGMISALVVRMEDGQPGKGFFSLAKDLGRDVSDPITFWINELERVRRAFE